MLASSIDGHPSALMPRTSARSLGRATRMILLLGAFLAADADDPVALRPAHRPTAGRRIRRGARPADCLWILIGFGAHVHRDLRSCSRRRWRPSELSAAGARLIAAVILAVAGLSPRRAGPPHDERRAARAGRRRGQPFRATVARVRALAGVGTRRIDRTRLGALRRPDHGGRRRIVGPRRSDRLRTRDRIGLRRRCGTDLRHGRPAGPAGREPRDATRHAVMHCSDPPG